MRPGRLCGRITNTTARLLLVFVEPEGWDCWLEPGESVELHVEPGGPDAAVTFTENDDGVTVWPAGTSGLVPVWQGSWMVDCGHQRPAGWP